jgi:hypothetical protein
LQLFTLALWPLETRVDHFGGPAPMIWAAQTMHDYIGTREPRSHDAKTVLLPIKLRPR